MGEIAIVSSDGTRWILRGVPLDETEGVNLLKNVLWEKYGIPTHCSILVRNGGIKLMDNQDSLYQQGVRDGDVLHLLIDSTDSSCSSPDDFLLWASLNGKNEAVRYLIEEEGLNPLKRVTLGSGGKKSTALFESIVSENPDITEFLLSVMMGGESPPAMEKAFHKATQIQSTPMLSHLSQHMKFPLLRNLTWIEDDDTSPEACEVADLLVEAGTFRNREDVFLILAVEEGLPSIVERLLVAGANPHIRVGGQKLFDFAISLARMTALDTEERNARMGVVEKLLQAIE